MSTDFKMRTAATTVSTEADVAQVCAKLVTASQWFSVTPLPDDQWEIEVKVENRELLGSWIRQINKSKPDRT